MPHEITNFLSSVPFVPNRYPRSTMKNHPESPPSRLLIEKHHNPIICSILSSLRSSLIVSKASAAFVGLAALTGASHAQITNTVWNMTAATPSASGTNATGSAIVSGNNNGTTTLLTTTSASNNLGASGGNNAGAATRTGILDTTTTPTTGSAYFEVTLTPQNGATLTLSEINFGSRSTSTGPQAYTVRTSTDSYAANFATGSLTNNSTWALNSNTGLSLAFSSATTFRIYGHNGAGNPSANTANWRIDDLTFKTSSAGGADGVPPAVSLLTPLDDATGVLVGSNLVVTFSENVFAIPAVTSKIELRKTSDNSLVEDFLINSSAVTGVGTNTISINPTTNLAYSTEFYVTFPAGLVEDAALNDFPGILTTTAWSFTTEAVPLPPAVVINKIFNSGGNNGVGDAVELLVTGNGTAGTFADLSGLFIKDFSSNITGDGGAQYQFVSGSIWNSVPVGTLIVLTRAGTSSDITSADFSLSVNLDDTVYFNKTGGTFDISAREMIMIKTAASTATGNAGNIHAMAASDGIPAPTLYDSTVPPKLISSTTLGSNAGVIATNPTSSIADFNGTNASTVAMTAGALGTPSNTENLVYINALRGIVPGDGSGLASITNVTVGAFSGLNMFNDAQTDNQSVKISVTAQVPSVTLTTVEITVPTGMGVPSAATVTGAGAGTPSVVIASQVVTISGLAVTNTNLIDITLDGLDTPVTSASDNGSQTFTIKTAIASGSLTSILTQPVAYVIVPIEAIRDVNVTTGVALDLNSIVAIEGVCTESQVFTTNTLAYLQDGNFGVAVFNSNPIGNPFIVGERYAVVGTVAQFSGVTQVTPSSFANVVSLGAGTSPTPLVITIPDLLLNAEAYEGRLVTVENLSPAVWSAPVSPATSVSVAMQDTASPTPNSLNIVITNGSGATTGPGGAANITGIFSQNDGSSPFTTGYQLLPREADDVDPLVSGFAAWIAVYYPGVTDVNIVGFNADPDLDGIPNGVEALTGGAPNVPGVFATSEFTKTANVFTFLYPQDSEVPPGIEATYQWSTDMINWQNDDESFGGLTVSLSDILWDNSDPEVTIYRVSAEVTTGTAVSLFVRVGAVD
jgi:hypothetical protein